MKVKFIKIIPTGEIKISLPQTIKDGMEIYSHYIIDEDVNIISEKVHDININNSHYAPTIDLNEIRKDLRIKTDGSLWPLGMIDSIISVNKDEFVPTELKKKIFDMEMKEIIHGD